MSKNQAPFPRYKLLVLLEKEIGTVSFTEVTGLDVQVEFVSHRSDSKNESNAKMPGNEDLYRIILKNGQVSKTSQVQNWLNEIKTKRTKRNAIRIQLFDQKEQMLKSFELSNAWPTNIVISENPETDILYIESLEINYEKMNLQNP